MSDTPSASALVDTPTAPPYSCAAVEVVTALGTDATSGLTGAEVAVRRSQYGPNGVIDVQRALSPARALTEVSR